MNTRSVPAVGIDLGTTYSAIAHLDSTGRPTTIDNAEGDKITPSVLLFEGEQIIVGKEAVKAKATDFHAIGECAKRDLGERVFHKAFNGNEYPPEAMQAWILNKLRQDASMRIGDFSKCVVTVPAYFDEVRRKATQDAGFLAGLDVMDIINEPTAAAVAYGHQLGLLDGDTESTHKETILVYDLGGGTFDVTIMQIGGTDFTALATDGDVQLGGFDWDQRLVDYVAEQFIRTYGTDPREDSISAGRLWRECQDAKHTLTAREQTTIACDHAGQAMRIEVTRSVLEDITRDLLERTAFTTQQTINAAGLTWDDIDRILLVGGSTRMPAVAAKLTELSGKELDRSVSPDEAVAHGAALHAGLLLDKHSGLDPNFTITNVNSHSLGVVGTDPETQRDRTGIVIPRNTQLPITGQRKFNIRAGQKSILVKIVEGESKNPSDCMPIGQCSIQLPQDLPPDSIARVLFRYREDGRLSVKVAIDNTDIVLKHDFIRENSMPQEAMDAWREYICGIPSS